MGVNKYIAIGYLGKDPEMTSTTNSKVAKFSIAISEKWTNKQGEKQESTEWVNCECWGKLAEIVEKYLKKGSQVYIEGKLKTDSYEKKGQKRYSTKVVVKVLQMLGNKPSGVDIKEPNISTDFEEKDDLPF